MKKLLKILILLGILLLFIFPFHAQAITMLPDPYTDIPGYSGPYDQLATWYEDFWVYSAKLNTAMGFSGFDYSTGTGKLDVIVYTGAGTKDRNQGVGPGGTFKFEDPLDAPAGSETQFSGTWGNRTSFNGPVYVDNVLSYLRAFDPTMTTPMFLFDLNQTGKNPNLQIVGRAYIYDPISGNGNIVKQWSFDNTDDGVYDPNDWITAYGQFTMYPSPYDVVHNIGSGKLDFIAYAPDMDLSPYEGKGYWFVADFKMQGLNDGFEELYLSGTFSPYVIPEPATLLLLGSGLIGLAGFARRRFKK